MFDSAQLKYFVAVARTGKIITASADLFVTPPTISASLTQLEKELGVSLFHRKANRLTLNRQGEIFLDYAETILAEMQEVRAEIRESLSNNRQLITVAVTSTDLWIDLIAAFLLRHPGITLSSVKLTPSDQMAGTFRDRFSFLLAFDGELSARCTDGCESLCLFGDRPAVMVHSSHPLASRSSVGVAEIARERLIWSKSTPQFQDRIHRLFRTSGIPIPVICTYSYLICSSLVSENAAVALTTMHARNSCTQDLCFIPLEEDDAPWQQRMYWRKGRPLSDVEQMFFDFMKDYYQKQKSKADSHSEEDLSC